MKLVQHNEYLSNTDGWALMIWYYQYRQFSNISCTQSQNVNVSHLVLQLSLPNPLKPCVKLRMKM